MEGGGRTSSLAWRLLCGKLSITPANAVRFVDFIQIVIAGDC